MDFYIPPGDSVALSKILLRLSEGAQLRQTIGTAAKAHIIQNHTWDIVVSKILSLSNLDNKQNYAGIPIDLAYSIAPKLHNEYLS